MAKFYAINKFRKDKAKVVVSKDIDPTGFAAYDASGYLVTSKGDKIELTDKQADGLKAAGFKIETIGKPSGPPNKPANDPRNPPEPPTS